jgi:precorrin-2/cobalt-factor-2 C20-methyltransferase
MKGMGKFFGVGVGPGPARLIPLAAWEALKQADLIFVPRARHVERSIARQCLAGLNLPEHKFKEIIYNMEPERDQLDAHYAKLAKELADQLRRGKTIAYLTIGDSLTYSTYSYLVTALLEELPGVEQTTFPGITSYSAIAAAFTWPLGQGKERILILPCPDDLDHLREDIEGHDVVVLMKIGLRLSGVLDLLREMGIAQHCVFASRLGLAGEVRADNLLDFEPGESLGYLSTMLIRKQGKERERKATRGANLEIGLKAEGG